MYVQRANPTRCDNGLAENNRGLKSWFRLVVARIIGVDDGNGYVLYFVKFVCFGFAGFC